MPIKKTFGHTGKINAFLVGSSGTFTVETLTGAQNLGVGALEVLFTPMRNKFPFTSVSYQGQFGSKYLTQEGMITIGWNI